DRTCGYYGIFANGYTLHNGSTCTNPSILLDVDTPNGQCRPGSRGYGVSLWQQADLRCYQCSSFNSDAAQIEKHAIKVDEYVFAFLGMTSVVNVCSCTYW